MKWTGFKIFLSLFSIVALFGCRQKENSLPAGLNVIPTENYLSWSVKMAESEMQRRGSSLIYGGSDPQAKWNYQTGLFLKSLLDLWEATGDSVYLEYVRKVTDSFLTENGEIKTYQATDYDLDMVNSGKVLLKLYQITTDKKYKRSAEILYDQLQKQPRTSEGGFWHKQRYPWQMWLDGIYMSSPFYAEFGSLFNQPGVIEDVMKQIKLIDTHTRDAQTGLRYHGWDESNKQVWADPVTGCSPHFWGRALGWYSMALVDVLDFIPVQYENRNQILYIFNDLIKAIIKYQDPDGLWYQIINLGDRAGNYLETSCSAMFVYTIAKAVNKGYLDHSYAEIATKAYKQIIKKMVTVDEFGRLNLNGICNVAGLGGDLYRNGSFDYYINEPVVSNDLKGVGPFIMAGIQLEKTKLLVTHK